MPADPSECSPGVQVPFLKVPFLYPPPSVGHKSRPRPYQVERCADG
jgi:hypothetical protein